MLAENAALSLAKAAENNGGNETIKTTVEGHAEFVLMDEMKMMFYLQFLLH